MLKIIISLPFIFVIIVFLFTMIAITT